MRRLALAGVMLALIGIPANVKAEEVVGSGAQPADAAMEHLSIKLPADALASDSIRRPLEELSREACDQQAIASLGTSLEKAGYRRQAANALLRFSETCGGHAHSIRKAVNILLGLSDFAATASAASKLIELEPFNDNGYYLRALANDKAGLPKKAIDDYITALELFGDKTRISSVAYLALARNYEKLGQFCDAAGPIEAWVTLNPAMHDTSQTRSIIATYNSKGGCPVAVAPREEVFPISRHNSIATVTVTVNGTRGNFVVDTGATFVSLKDSFAQKAKVAIDGQSSIQLSTANGLAEGKLGRAETVQVRSLQAKDVPVVVQAGDKALYGNSVDGLLGMSFLSRFNMAMDGKSVKLSAKMPR